MHQGGARDEGGRRGARGEVSAKLSNGGGWATNGLLFSVGVILL